MKPGMRVLKFQTRLPTGQVEQVTIESERVLIGSGAHCEIRLPLAEAGVEHVLVELGLGLLRGRLRAAGARYERREREDDGGKNAYLPAVAPIFSFNLRSKLESHVT